MIASLMKIRIGSVSSGVRTAGSVQVLGSVPGAPLRREMGGVLA